VFNLPLDHGLEIGIDLGGDLQAKFARCRKDALHKAIPTIVKNRRVVVIENLKVGDHFLGRRPCRAPARGTF
jgi:hypothetical protein